MVQTYLSTDWLELRGAMAKVVLTDESETYLVSVANGRAELFRLDARRLRREDFFNALFEAWGEAERMPIERAFELRIVADTELEEVIRLSQQKSLRRHVT